MKLIEEMKIELGILWHQALRAPTPESRRHLMAEYSVEYSKYRRQLKFQRALRDGQETLVR